MVNCVNTVAQPVETDNSICGRIKAFWRSPVGCGMGVVLFIAIICGVIIPVVINSVNNSQGRRRELVCEITGEFGRSLSPLGYTNLPVVVCSFDVRTVSTLRNGLSN